MTEQMQGGGSRGTRTRAEKAAEPDLDWGLDEGSDGDEDDALPELKRTAAQLEHEAKLLAMFRKRYDAGMEGWKANRERAAHDDKFLLGMNQWSDIAKSLRKGRPMPTVNKTHLSHFQIVNDFQQNMPSPDIGPDDDQAHAEVARVLMGLWRYTDKRSKAKAHRLLAFAQAVSGGYGYWEVGLDWANDRDFELETVIKPVPDRFSIVDDMSAILPAGADRRFLFKIGTIDKADAKQRYPFNHWEECNSAVAGDKQAALWQADERPEILVYWRRIKGFKSVTDRMRVTEQDADGAPKQATARTRQVPIYEVLWCKTNGHELLYDRNGNPCRGVFGSEWIPFVRCDGWKTWVDKKWHLEGNLHQAIDSQELNNYAEAGVAEFVGLASKAPYMGPMKAIAAYKAIWDTANTKPWSYLPYDIVTEQGVAVKPERVEPPAPPTALLALRENQNQNLRESLGMFQASTGQSVNDESGYARAQVRSENDTNHYHFATGFADALQHEVTILLDLWANLYKGGKTIPTLDEDWKTVKRVPVNGQQPNPEQPRAMWTDRDEQNRLRPHYDLRVGRYGVTVKMGPSSATQAEQNRMGLDALISRIPPQMAGALAPFYVKNLNSPDQDKMFNVMVAMQPQPLQGLYRDDPEGLDPAQSAKHLKAIVAQTIPIVKMQQQMIQQLQGQVNDKQREQALKAMDIATREVSKRLDTIGKVTATQMTAEASVLKAGMKSGDQGTAFAGAEHIDQTADDARADAKAPPAAAAGGGSSGTGGLPGMSRGAPGGMPGGEGQP